jgi:hypothetical protein
LRDCLVGRIGTREISKVSPEFTDGVFLQAG